MHAIQAYPRYVVYIFLCEPQRWNTFGHRFKRPEPPTDLVILLAAPPKRVGQASQHSDHPTLHVANHPHVGACPERWDVPRRHRSIQHVCV